MVGYRVMDRDAVTLGGLVKQELSERGLGDLPVVIGGIVRRDARAELEKLGVKRVFGPGTRLQDISDFVYAETKGTDA